MKNVSLLLQLLVGLTTQASEIAALLNRAKAENRDVTDAELDILASGDDASRDALKEAIYNARHG